VHKSTGLAFGSAQAVGVMRNDAERDRTEDHMPAIGLLVQADRFAGESLVDVDLVAAPLDPAIRADPPPDLVRAVLGLTQYPIEGPRRGVMRSRRIVAKRRVRAFFVVLTLKDAEALELLAQRACRRVGGVLEQRQMKPLQPAVLLRLARLDALRQHAGFDHV